MRRNNFLKLLTWQVICLAVILMTGCQSNSTGDPARKGDSLAANSRIRQNPDKFAGLNDYQKKFVTEGKIAKWMNRDAVRLTWGRPDKIEKLGSKKEQWLYYRNEEVAFDSSSPFAEGTLANRFGRHVRGSEKFYDGHKGSNSATVQSIDKTVLFEDGNVASWTRTRF